MYVECPLRAEPSRLDLGISPEISLQGSWPPPKGPSRTGSLVSVWKVTFVEAYKFEPFGFLF